MGETRRLEGLGQLGFDFPVTKSTGVPARSQGNAISLGANRAPNPEQRRSVKKGPPLVRYARTAGKARLSAVPSDSLQSWRIGRTLREPQ